MKIALVSDDGKTISAHFGRAKYYLIAEVQDGRVIERTLIERQARCGCGDNGHDHDHGHNHDHDHEHGHGEKHQAMFAPISDCQALIARGMGRGANLGLQQAGIQAILTGHTEIEAALEAYLGGTLINQPERVH